MHSRVSTVILSDSPQTIGVVGAYLQDLDLFDCLECPANYSEIYDLLLSCENVILVVDISNDYDLKLDFVLKVTQNVRNCKVLILSDNPSVEIIVKAMRVGAKEFLPLPIIKSEFKDAVCGLHKLFFVESEEKSSKCTVISVFSNKGGLGKTSIAANLSLELAKITKEKVALIDLNFQLGDVTTFLDLKPSFNISYMLQNLDKMNEDFLLSTLERYNNTSLFVLADPPFFKQADDISPVQITRLLNMLKDTFSYVIVDAEASFDAKNVAALTDSDIIFLVTVANLPALRNSQRCIELFGKMGFDADKVQIVLNRFMENDVINVQDIEKLLGKDVYWKIPNNYFAVMSAINKGIPVSEVSPNSNIAVSYKNFAMHLADSIYRDDLCKKYEKLIN